VEAVSAVDTAWKIHTAQVDWTGRVDTKASFGFGIESAALGLTVALSAAGRTYAAIDGFAERALYWSGLACLLAGAFLSLLVVIPRLRHKVAESEAGANYIYFGHVRHWDAAALAERLSGEDDLLEVITRQCVVMANIAWRKHRLVQLSMTAGGIGIGLLVFAAALVAAH
jgi:hypothetical protein